MPERDWSAFACPNPDCPAYGQKGQGNLRPHGWSSKQRGIRCLRCATCGRNFSQRAGTPLFRTHLAEDKAQEFHEQLVRHVHVNQVQADEAWAFVGKKGQAL